jgi:hypothetical protein
VKSSNLLLVLHLFIMGCHQHSYTNRTYFNFPKTNNFKLETDRQKLIYTILERAITKKDLPDYNRIKDPSRIYILDHSYAYFFGTDELEMQRLDDADIPSRINEVRFCMKSDDELQAIADKEGKYMYFSIGQLEINDSTATIGLTNSWKVPNNSKEVMMSGGGYVWRLKKENDQWVFEKIIHNFVS